MKQKILAWLEAAPKASHRHIPVRLPNRQVEALTSLAAAITKHSRTRTSRNMLVEDAIEAFVEEWEKLEQKKTAEIYIK